jgi:ribosomal protein S6E (S10)
VACRLLVQRLTLSPLRRDRLASGALAAMKLNIANPSTGCQKLFDIDDEKKLRTLYDRRLAAEVDGGELGDEFTGYIFKVLGGQDKQGFPMKQGVLTSDRVRVMMAKGAAIAPPAFRASDCAPRLGSERVWCRSVALARRTPALRAGEGRLRGMPRALSSGRPCLPSLQVTSAAVATACVRASATASHAAAASSLTTSPSCT